LILPHPLEPIGTYEISDEEEHRVIPGIIFIADIADEGDVIHNYSHQKHTEIIWLDPGKFHLEQHQCVPNFGATIARAVEARRRIGKVQECQSRQAAKGVRKP
jgi:hypothetical protein